MHKLTPGKDVKTCIRCGVKLTDFVAYIPDLGEVCMKCYTEYAEENELITRLPSTRNSDKGGNDKP